MILDRLAVRAAAVLVVAVMGMAAGGCGSDDSDDGQASGADAAEQRNVAETGGDGSAKPVGSDKDQIKAVLAGIQEDFVNADPEAYCDKLIEAEQREVAAFGRALQHGTTCVNTMRTLMKLTNESGVKQKPTRYISAKVNGDRATATVSNGGRPPEPMEFVRVDGEWKMVESGMEPNPFAPVKKKGKS